MCVFSWHRSRDRDGEWVRERERASARNEEQTKNDNSNCSTLFGIFFERSGTLSVTLAKSNSVGFKMNTWNFYDCTQNIVSLVPISFFASPFCASKRANDECPYSHLSSDKRVFSLRHIHLCGILRFYVRFSKLVFFILLKQKSHFFPCRSSTFSHFSVAYHIPMHVY